MKVVVAHNRYSSAQPSGENSVVDAELAQLSSVGVTVIPFIRSSDEIADMSAMQKLGMVGSPIYGRKAQKDLARVIETQRPDLIHLHNPYPFLSPAVIATAQARSVPVVQTVHNYRHECLNGLYFRDGAACHDCRGKTFDLPGVRHGCYRGSRAQSLIMATALSVNRRNLQGADCYIALTDAIAEHLRRFGVDDSRIRVKPNAVADPGPHDIAGDGFVSIGRLSEEKGIGLLLDAWRRHPQNSLGTLTVAGDGPLRGVVEAAARERDDVRYVGQVTPKQRDELLADSAALIASSLCEDVLPTVVIEALASARPVLTTDLGGPPSMIGEAGLVCEPTVDGMAEALPLMRQRARDLAPVARKRYLDTFTTEVVMARHLDIYRRVAAGEPVNDAA